MKCLKHACRKQGCPVCPATCGHRAPEAFRATLAAFLKPCGKAEADLIACHTPGVCPYDALDHPRPARTPYVFDTLREARDRFARHGQRTEIV